MKWHEKIGLLFHLLRWRLTWSRIHLDYKPPGPVSGKFLSAREAAGLIPDGAVVFSSGIAGNARCTTFFFAIRDRYKKSGHPKNLTWVNGGAQGSRGRVPGTVEDLALPGLLNTYIAGHLETAKAELLLGDQGLLEIHTLPQGIIALLLDAYGKGLTQLKSTVGLDTFIDPTFGNGSAVTPHPTQSFVSRAGESLVYQMPRLDVALFNVPYADAEGNLYFRHASTLTEIMPSLRAVRANNGIAMATVSQIIPKAGDEVSIPAEEVDVIVVNPFNEQVASVRQRRYWEVFTPEDTGDIHHAVEKLDFINKILHITPVRTPVGWMMGRMAADLFMRVVPRRSMINIGVGYPEEVVRLIVENGLEQDFTFTTEAGSYGGLPAPGIFFGAAIHPRHLESSSKMFERYRNELDAAVLGFLQFDGHGNVNVSKRGPAVSEYVGPGGFPDITNGAQRIIFIGSWMHRAKAEILGEKMVIHKHGKPKFVAHVDEVTFNGKRAIQMGKEVYFVTDVGVFQLMPKGVQLIMRVPGIDLPKDIRGVCGDAIQIPVPGKLRVAAPEIITGQGFGLSFPKERPVLA